MAVDYAMFNMYNNILIEKRGYITKSPENKAAVMLISGGLDSITTTARLMEDFHLRIFPLYIDRGQGNQEAEKQSMIFFEDYFLNRYKENFNKVETIKANVPPKEIKNNLQYHANILDLGYPLRDNILHFFAVQYAVALSFKLKEDIRTIFNGVIKTDEFHHENIVAMRINTILSCQCMNDWRWQITSPNVDEIFAKTPFGKDDEVKWAFEHNIPIEKTMTCYKPKMVDNKFVHCGKCLACEERINAFKNANINDRTEYYI